MKNLKTIFGVLSILIMIVVASSCKKKKDASVIITVLQDSINQITLDTSSTPAAQVSVRFYLNQIGAEHIDTTILTNTEGKAEFVWFEDAIIQYDVVAGSFSLLEEFVILEQGETIEETVNIDQ